MQSISCGMEEAQLWNGGGSAVEWRRLSCGREEAHLSGAGAVQIVAIAPLECNWSWSGHSGGEADGDRPRLHLWRLDVLEEVGRA